MRINEPRGNNPCLGGCQYQIEVVASDSRIRAMT